MTDTTIDTASERTFGELAHLDPNTLDIGDNVREYANLTKPFLDSIREHGVLVPLTAIRRHDGTVQVRNGQRRTVAAREVGLSTVPVYVLTANAADTDAETIDRIVHQIVTNDQKNDLTDAQRARGIQQMIDAGMSVTRVAKKLSIGKDMVTAAKTAAASSTALEVLDTGQLNLTEAAVLTEFEEDGPDVVERLVHAAGTAQFDHVVAQLRSERASAQARTDAEASYVARGFTILGDEDRWGWRLDRVALRHLQRTGEDGTPEGVDESAITDAQFWGVRLDEYDGYVDAEGNEVTEEEIDWDTEGDPQAIPAEGMRHADTVREQIVFEPEWYCLNPQAAGLQVSDTFQRNAEWATRDRTGESSLGTTDLDTEASEADREAARERAEAEQAEAKKRERRIVVTLNKLGAASTEVRRAFVRMLLSRKTLPKGAATFIADCLVRDSYMMTQHDGPATAAELLGIDAAAITIVVRELPAGSDNRAMVITLALILGALEARTGKDAWRQPAPLRAPGEDRIYYGRQVTSGDYLRFLAEHGYALAAVEEVITGSLSSDQVYDQYTAEADTQ
jgi:ParB family chromosome partitioning protein